jgi:hypothetical protein
LALDEVHLSRDKELSVIISKQLQFPLLGPLVGDTWILEPNAREYDDISWFMETIEKIVLRPGVVEHYLEGQQSALRTLTNCYESPDASNFYTNDDKKKAMESDDHEAPEDRGNSKVPEPLRVLAPFLDGVCRLIEDESDILCAKKGMNIIMKKLLERKKIKYKQAVAEHLLYHFRRWKKETKIIGKDQQARRGSNYIWKERTYEIRANSERSKGSECYSLLFFI